MSNEATRRKQYRDNLVRQHLDLVYQIATAEYHRFDRRIEFDDLVAFGVLGLCEAAARYDVTKGASFSTYAMPRVRGAMYDGVGKTAALPRSVYRAIVQSEYPPIHHVPYQDTKLPRAIRSSQCHQRMRLLTLLDQSDALSRLRSAIEQLSEDERHVITRYDLDGVTLTQAASELGLSKSATSRLRRRALRSLRRALRRES